MVVVVISWESRTHVFRCGYARGLSFVSGHFDYHGKAGGSSS
jgi:hypothetical protein